jgi:hypothetical protein
VVDGDRGSSHVLLPSVAPKLATAPVCFSRPKAPPIAAPEVGMFTLTIPQSDPFDPIHYKKKQKISNWQSRSNHLEYVLDALGENTVFRTVTLLYAGLLRSNWTL